ncbi:hypothetical protein DPMN_068394 [Dreissena polymorpha]|uniref:SRCR domain-containing protein n=1 Tax=Dreissena polymorpha TaxID=45954 RepID=A0A9D3Z1J2_DREPO|nr:hypothetical protein DPMN_068394 [Dreissena polymorpha]
MHLLLRFGLACAIIVGCSAGANITGYRLAPNGLPCDGLLEVNIPGSCDWGPVRYISRYNWRDPLDDLICQHFGYVNESVVQPAAKQGSYPDACMTITRCSTDAMKTIHDIPDKCDIQYGPPRSDYDNLYKEIKCIPAQLLDGATPLQGRVEAGLFGQLQSICSLGFDARAANVTCASLGYRRGVTQVWQNSHFGAGLKPIYKRNITCSGDELSLELCNHSNTDIPGCDGSNVVGIECKGDMIKLDPLFGSRPYEGILEGFHDDFRYDVIGSVSNTTAKTLCAMLGHGFVGFAGLAIPSRNLHYYKMDVSCSGTEKSINECKGDLEYCVAQRYWHCMTMSNMHRHVALFCSDYELQGLRLNPDGVLLMTVNSKQWAVCEDHFTQQTANEACRILDYTGHPSITTHTAGANDTEVLGSLICQENATSLADCHVKHQFSYRPYRVDNACRNYVKLNCTHLFN